MNDPLDDMSDFNVTLPNNVVHGLSAIYVASMLFIIVLNVVGNSMVIISIVKRQLYHTNVANYFILSMAVNDLLVGVIVVPCVLLWWMEVIENYAVEVGVYVLDCFLTHLSSYHIVIVNLDRYVAITRPLDYTSLLTPERVQLILFVHWVAGVIFTVLCYVAGVFDSDMNDSTWYTHKYHVYTVTEFLLPLTLICVIYTRLYCVVRKHIQLIDDQARYAGSSSTATGGAPASHGLVATISTAPVSRVRGVNRRRHLKFLKVFGVVTGVLLVCMGPYFILTNPLIQPHLNTQWLFNFYGLMLTCEYGVSALNPYIYVISFKEYRLGGVRSVCGCCGGEAGLGGRYPGKVGSVDDQPPPQRARSCRKNQLAPE